MRSGHRTNPALLAAVLGAIATPSFLGAQRQIEVTNWAPPAFSLGFGGGRNRKSKPGKRTRSGQRAHCGARQAARYAKRISADAFNYHFDNRMRWNAEVYPRVLEQREKRRTQGGRQVPPHRSGGFHR